MEINNDSIVLPLPTDTFLEKEEKMWRVALPKSYKDFLKKYNGGTPEHKSFLYSKSFLCDR
ncbi:SMI1/KNR4 family protein [Sporolactobacillus sp. KGMB 08714]|uniref:SMI1/KNR4 family protein n=1 Tax=Sporolactobacillus sp. KGMB 08714 TaxID=3064704 RepID=UPI003FA73B97